MSAVGMPFMNADGTAEVIEYSSDYKPIEYSAGQLAGIEAGLTAARNGGEFHFITGKAGTGKSTILRKLRSMTRCIVLAPTGLAAINVGGETIHRFFRFGTGPKKRGNCRPLDDDKAEVLERTRLIIIDEISMVRADLLDAINWTCQKTLGSDEPFGGISVVAFGDMFQIEPVVGDTDAEKEMFGNGGRYESPFWFDAQCVSPKPAGLLDEIHDPVNVQIHNLDEVFRQKGDDEFIEALNQIRIGDERSLAMLNTRKVDPPKHPAWPRITFTNAKALSANQREMAAIADEPHVYEATITGDFPEKEYPVEEKLELKVGARVMVCKNHIASDGYMLVNGDMGEVIKLDHVGPTIWTDSGREVRIEAQEWKMLEHVADKESDSIREKERGCFRQIPIKLAWAITTHKSQGQTLDGAVLTLDSQVFAHGLLYVALSRVRTRDGLFLARKLTKRDIVVHPRILAYFGEGPSATTIDDGAFG